MSKFRNKSSYIIIAKFFEVILFFDYVFYSLSICECSKKILSMIFLREQIKDMINPPTPVRISIKQNWIYFEK